MADPVPMEAETEKERFFRLAFDESVAAFYGPLYYVSASDRDLRIAFGVPRPISSSTDEMTAERFNAAVTLPLQTARDLAHSILQILGEEKADA